MSGSAWRRHAYSGVGVVELLVGLLAAVLGQFTLNPGSATALEQLPAGAAESAYPFGISLTLGGAADIEAEPEWQFTVNFSDRIFEITASAGQETEAFDQLSRCYPELRPAVTAREDHGEIQRPVGTLSDVTGS